MERTGKTALHYAAANESSGGSITGEGLYGWLLTMGSDIDHEDHVRNYNIEFLYVVNPIIYIWRWQNSQMYNLKSILEWQKSRVLLE